VDSTDGYLAQVIADLARHAEVDAADIEVISSERVMWASTALGRVDVPGLDVLVEGYRIVLRIGKSEFAYHGERGKPPFRCDNPDPLGWQVVT
jgi:hypothetical protein